MKTPINKLVHPATLFIQHLPFSEVAFKDMTPMQQRGIWEFMDMDSEGIWADHMPDLEGAIALYGDVRFGVGKFANDDTLKEALVASTDGADDEGELDAWFKTHFTCGDGTIEQPPVVLNRADWAPEFGLFEWGYEGFYSYWAHLPETEFITFLPDWNPGDESGRGGQ